MKSVVLFLMLGTIFTTHAQIQNDSPLYVSEGDNVYLSTDVFNFGTGSVSTSRATTYGVLSFGATATYSGESNTNFIDGYARTYKNGAFIFPIGQTGLLAPAKVVTTNTAGVDAAYFSADPTVVAGTTMDASVSAVSTYEYWVVKGATTPSVLSLSWRSASALTTFAGLTTDNLTIAGWDGTKWIEIPSVVDATSFMGTASTTTSGSITSEYAVTLSDYSYFTIASKANACAVLVASNGVTKTWNFGAWTPAGTPSLANPVIINGPYDAATYGSFSCNSIVLNNDITLPNGKYLEIVNGATGTGKIVMASEASVVQRNPASTAPTILLTKITRPMRRFDYVFLSSPISSGTDFYNLLYSTNNVAVNGNYGTQALSAFSAVRELNVQGTGYQNTTSVTIGKGNNAFVRNQAPYSTSAATGSWNDQYNNIHIKVPGTANNGNVSVSVPGTYSAMIGNPYPSAIDGEKMLIAAGDNVRKTIYYWTFATPVSATQAYDTVGGYATWTFAGGTSATNSTLVPDGSIASMQSVILKAANSTPSTFNITNCMRKTGDNDIFFRTAEKVKDRYWLNLTGTSNTQSQILLAYLPDATYGDDVYYDASRFQGSSNYSYLSSLIADRNYVIQARPSFVDTDVVPLSLFKASDASFTIGIGNREGVFSTGEVPVYLHDKQLGIYHNLLLSDYTFTQAITGNDPNRFEMVYNSLLANAQFNDHECTAFIKDNKFNATALTSIVKVQLFDIAGRAITTFTANDKKVVKEFNHAQGVYIAKIHLDNGTVVTQKLINGF